MKKAIKYKTLLKFILSIIITFALVSVVHAYQITSELDGLPVDVEATFTFDYAADTITIEMDNLIINPTSVIQNLSGLGFALDTGNPDAVLSGSSATLRNVANDGTFTDSGSGDTGWALANDVVFPFGTGYQLYVLGTPAGPGHTLIGQPDSSNLYSNANASIAGNDPHNPFIFGPASFTLDFASYDLTPEDTITGLAWYFGTTPSVLIPEPSTLILLGLGLVGIAGLRRRE